MTHDDYWGVVNGGKALTHANTAIRSFNHINKTVRAQKTSLSALDTKRWILEDGISSRAYGHWRTKAEMNAEEDLYIDGLLSLGW